MKQKVVLDGLSYSKEFYMSTVNQGTEHIYNSITKCVNTKWSNKFWPITVIP